MGAVADGQAVLNAVERMLAAEALGTYRDADPEYVVLVGPAAWDALRAYGTGLGLNPGMERPDVRDRVLGYSLLLDPFLGGQVRLAWMVQEAQAVPNG